MTKLVYLAGANFGKTFKQCLQWRNEAQDYLRQFGIEAHIPVDEDWNQISPMDLVNRDLISLLKCQAMLVDCNQPSWGTAMEVWYAFHSELLGRKVQTCKSFPIVGWTYEPMQLSPWAIAHIDPIFPSLEQACTHIARSLNHAA